MLGQWDVPIERNCNNETGFCRGMLSSREYRNYDGTTEDATYVDGRHVQFAPRAKSELVVGAEPPHSMC